MSNQHIYRTSSRRRGNSWLWGCGCLIGGGFFALAGVMVLYTSGALLPLILGVFGVDQVGDTDELFAGRQAAPTLVISDPVAPPNQAVIDLGVYGEETVQLDTRDYTVVLSGSESSALASFSESALLEMCYERSVVCREGNDQLRDVSIDLKSGGAVIYADANTGFNWQRVGVVMQLDNAATQFEVVGVDVGGTTYNPASLPFGLSDVIGDTIDDIEREGNAILAQLVVSTGGDTYRLQSVSIDESMLTLNMRG